MTKREKKFREMLKQAFMDFKDCYDTFGGRDDDTRRSAHDLSILEQVARDVFGWTEKRIEINEDRWRKEWNKRYERKC